jgi:hypothetical protein
MMESYNFIADEHELEWFFNHALFPLKINESYSMILVSRHKKMTEEEKKKFAMSRKQSEFLQTEILRRPKLSGVEVKKLGENNITFRRFLRTVARFNVDKRAYVTADNTPVMEKTMAILIYINPCDDMKVVDMVMDKVNDYKSGFAKAVLNGKVYSDCESSFQAYGNLSDQVNHAKAVCKGTVYWMDFDIDVPPEFKTEKYNELHTYLISLLGKGNFIFVDTSGGYHLLVRNTSIHFNPHIICDKIKELIKGYNYDKFEVNLTGSETGGKDNDDNTIDKKPKEPSIPGIPLPGTYQYARPVTVANKEDFDDLK